MGVGRIFQRGAHILSHPGCLPVIHGVLGEIDNLSDELAGGRGGITFFVALWFRKYRSRGAIPSFFPRPTRVFLGYPYISPVKFARKMG